jgi:flagellar protein FliO/FliZ
MTEALASVPAAAAALAAVLALVLLLARLARRRLLPQIRTGRRLALQESMALDSKRRLCLVTCDGRPLLLLIGGAQDIVVGWLPAEGAP